MPDLSDAALTALADHACLRTDQSVDRNRIAQMLITELETNHVAHNMNEVGQVEIDAGQLSGAIFGVDLVDLVDLVKPLLSTGPDGAVQRGLENGYMLCSGRLAVEAEVSGQVKRVSFTTRFLSDDETVIQAHLLDPRTRRAESMGENNRRLGMLTTTRQPALTQRVSTWATNLQQAFNLALNPGASEA